MKNNKQIAKQNTFTEFLLYTTPSGKVNVEIFLRDENLWLTQDKIAALFGVQRPAITKHLKNIFESGELQENSVSSILELTADDGKKYSIQDRNYESDFDREVKKIVDTKKKFAPLDQETKKKHSPERLSTACQEA